MTMAKATTPSIRSYTEPTQHTFNARKEPIRAVTVFRNRALVERVFKVELQAGPNEIIVRRLPPSIDLDSLRVEADALGVAVHDVNHTVPKPKATPKSSAKKRASASRYNSELEGFTDEQIDEYVALSRKQSLLTTRIDALVRTAELLQTYADSFVDSRPRFASDLSEKSLFTIRDAEAAGAAKYKALPSLQELDEFVAAYPQKLEAGMIQHQEAQEEFDSVTLSLADLRKEARKHLESVYSDDDEQKDMENRPSFSFGQSRPQNVVIVVGADTAVEAELVLSYFVVGPTWSGAYDIHASLPDSKSEADTQIKLVYRASIQQETGEDWKHVPLTLSTATVTSSVAIPRLQPWRIGVQDTSFKAFGPFGASPLSAGENSKAPSTGGLSLFESSTLVPDTNTKNGATFGQQRPVQQQQQQQQFVQLQQQQQPVQFQQQQFIQPQQQQSSLFGKAAAVQPEMQQQQQPTGATKSLFGQSNFPGSSVVAAVIKVEGRSSIPSDPSSHKVLIKTLVLDAQIDWVAVPRVQAAAFLQCQVKNNSDAVLIGGPSQVFFDGNFVAKSTIPDVSPGESFSCSLGIDPSVKVIYHPQKRVKRTDKSNTPWYALAGNSTNSGPTDIKAFTSRITVTNTRKRPLTRLILRDQVPVSEDERVKVKLMNPSNDALGPLVPSSSTTGTAVAGKRNDEEVVPGPVWASIRPGVKARWAQKSEKDGGTGGSRGDGVVEWHCSDVKDELDVELSWEVAAPHDVAWRNMSLFG